MPCVAMLQAIEANLASRTRRVSSELSISQSSVVCHLHNFHKISQSWWIVPYIAKYYQTFDLPKFYYHLLHESFSNQ